MARYCNWSTETPRFERCMNLAEEGTYRCAEHAIKKKRREGDLSSSEKNKIREYFGFKCAICGSYATEIDHIEELDTFAPDEKWKANLLSNLQLLCFHHHSVKTARYRKSKIDVGDPNDRSTSARNRKKKRRRAQGFHY